MHSLSNLYRQQLQYPWFWLTLMLAITLVATWQSRQFSFDASSDQLVVQGDPGLAQYRKMSAIFSGDDFIVLAWHPRAVSQFDREALTRLDKLQQAVAALPGVIDVQSILDVPLVKSPPIPIEQMADQYRTLRDKDVDLALARTELTSSPLFKDYLISKDGTASVLKIDLEPDERLSRLQAEMDAGRNVTADFRGARQDYVDRRQELIDGIRSLRLEHLDFAEIYISGVPMIAADMIDYVKSDLFVFGSLVLIAIVVLLIFFFRRTRWVLLPLIISASTILMTTGILATADKPVTVVSSNFVSLLAILCISFSIHLIVRYRELLDQDPDMAQEDLVFETMYSKFAPCLYTALTTVLAFGSMMASRILPVEDFGWMMCLGILIAFVVTFIVFPSTLMLLGKGKPSATLGSGIALTRIFSKLARNHSTAVIIAAVFVTGVAGYGLTLITYDNRFIDYFDDDTDIHKGMTFIDEHLGGTVPFDVYVQLGKFESVEEDDFFSSDEDTWPERYWFTADRVKQVRELQDIIAAHPATGKVISIATLELEARSFNEGEPLSSLELAYVLGQLPAGIRDQLLVPYADPETGYARINARTRESGGYFSRDKLIASIEAHAADSQSLNPDDVAVTGMMVLFNDMLKRLADSQLQTLLYVIGATLIMFTLLLRSITLAAIALVPNVIAAASVTAVMGFASIPLDMMTITIAAISIGIGVDDAIHYLHRFSEEFKENDVKTAVANAHESIGRAMYFTSIVIFLGFSILVFSNFLPTVYFGLLTALAMFMALLANLTLLPALLVTCYRGPLSRF